MDRLPPLAAVRAFECAGRHQNFSRAAEELGMTQAAVSYQIRQLEDRLGKPLFVRARGRVELSDAGRRLLPEVTAAFAQMARAFGDLREEDEDVLTLNASTSIGSTWISARIGRFQLAYPDLALRLTLSDVLVDFASGTAVDAAIRVGAGKWEGLRADFLFRQHFTPMCSPEFLQANNVRTPEDLLHVERLTPNDQLWASWFAEVGMGNPPAPRVGVVMDNQLQEASAMRGGYGIAMMSPLYWRAELDSGRLVQPFETLFYSRTSQWLVYPAHRTGVRKIREWLRDELAGDRDSLPEAVWSPA